MAQKFGRATINLNGAQIDSEQGASFDPGGVTRNSETSDHQVNYSESLRPAVIRCRMPLTRGVSLKQLNEFEGTVQFNCDTGQSYICANAFRVGELTATGGTNEAVDIEIHSGEAVEVGV